MVLVARHTATGNQAVVEVTESGGGSIINDSSIYRLIGGKGVPIYCVV